MKRRIVMYNRCVCIDCCRGCVEDVSNRSSHDTMAFSDAASISYTISIC